jgi:hypothetical protein
MIREQHSFDSIKSEITKLYKNIYGEDIDISTQSFNNYYIVFFTELVIKNYGIIAELYDSLDPNLSTGKSLDSICEFNNIVRKQAYPSIVTCICSGLSGTSIPENQIIYNQNNEEFYNKEAFTIDNSQSATVLFYSKKSGIINCDANTINRINQQVYGWDSVNNPTDGIIGSDIQDDIQLRNSRTLEISKLSLGSLYALGSNLENAVFVRQWAYITSSQNGVIIPDGYLYCSVLYDEGYDEELAEIIVKSAVTAYYGETEFTVVDKIYPWNSIIVKWHKATQVMISLIIKIIYLSIYPSKDILAEQIRTSCIDNININERIYVDRFASSYKRLGVTTSVLTLIGILGGAEYSSSLLLPVDKCCIFLNKNIIVEYIDEQL